MTSLTTYSSFSPGEKCRKAKSKCGWIPARHVLAIMAFLGFCNVYAMRINLSVALIAMVNVTGTGRWQTDSEECPDTDVNSTKTSSGTGEFNWDERTQGHVLASFFYGYLLTNFLGGWFASQYGGKHLFGLGILSTAILTLLTPLAARWSVFLLIALRVLEGVGEGVTYPSVQAMWGKWAPEMERSKLSAFTYGGSMFGAVITLPVAGFLCHTDFLGGWPSAFYVFGALGCLWYIAWHILVYSSPSQHPRISQEEKEHIESSIGKIEAIPTPWKSILTSPQVIAICIGQFCGQWNLFMFITCLPTYLSTIQKFDIQSNGFVSALPYLPAWILTSFVGVLADYLRSRKYLTTVNTRRLFNTIGTIGPGVLVVLCGYAGCDRVLVVFLLTLSCSLQSFVFCGAMCSGLDIAPRFSGIIMGMSNGLATMTGFIAPLLVGYLTNNNQTAEQWRKIFYINAALGVFGSVVYAVFITDEELPWAKIQTTDKEDGSEKSSHDQYSLLKDKSHEDCRLLEKKENIDH